MEAMILAAGRGQRLKPITDKLPKPLVPVGELTLIEHHIRNLSRMGFNQLIINISYLHELIIEKLGSGKRYGVTINYSHEPNEPIGTAAGIQQAADLFTGKEILIVNGDVYTDYNFLQLQNYNKSDIHLVLVPNPPHHESGDFSLVNKMLKIPSKSFLPTYTYSGIGVFKTHLFRSLDPETKELGTMIKELINSKRITAEIYNGVWIDVGTVERLQQARELES